MDWKVFFKKEKYWMILWVILLFQQILFYHITDLNLLFVVYTMILLTGIIMIGRQIKWGKGVLTILFLLSGVLLFIQCLHYTNFSKFASFRDVSKLIYAGPVMDVAASSIHLEYFLFLIPFFYMVVFFRRFSRKKWELPFSYFGISCLAIYVVAVWTFLPTSKTEIVAYHIDDFYQTFFYEPELIMHPEVRLSSENLMGKEFGKFENYNLINIQVESLSGFVIDMFYDGQEITPNLNALIRENSLYFDNYYQMIGNGHTSDAEFVINNSLYPALDGPMYQNYWDRQFHGLPWILRENGYGSYVFHGYDKNFWNRSQAYPGQGFQKFYDSTYYKIGKSVGFGLKDEDFFEQSIPYLKKLRQPFYSFLITLTSHVPFDMPEEEQKIQLREEHKNTTFGKYLQAIHYTDKTLGEFISALKKENLYDSSVITIYGDHYAIDGTDSENQKVMTEYFGKEYDVFSMMNVPFIIHAKSLNGSKQVHVVGSHLDYTPTILNLLGISQGNNLFMGQDLLNTEVGFVALQGLYTRGSFVEGNYGYQASRDYLFESGEFVNLHTGEKTDVEKARRGFEKAIMDANNSDVIIKKDLIQDFMKKTETVQEDRDEEISGEFYRGELVENMSQEKTVYLWKDFYWDQGTCVTTWKGEQISLEKFKEQIKPYSNVQVLVSVKEKLGKVLDLVEMFQEEEQSRFVPVMNYMTQYAYIQGLGYEKIALYLDDMYTSEEICSFLNIAKGNSQFIGIVNSSENEKTDLYQGIGVCCYMLE